ncbi:MAG: hypothetical protein HRT61_04135 [Ekhidna sp.]|nr:hypothetical protein [Ekhidna sp.]
MKKYFSVLLLILTALSCDETDTEDNLTSVENPLEIVESSIINMIGDMTSIGSTKGALALRSLADLIELDLEEIGLAKNGHLQSFIVKATVDSDPNLLAELHGTYTWDFDKQEFIRTESEGLIIRFPSGASSFNNSELTIRELRSSGLKQVNLPTSIEATLTVDGEQVSKLIFEVEWSMTGLPVSSSIIFELDPYIFSVNFDDTFDQKSSLLASISEAESTLIAVDLSVEFVSSRKEEFMALNGGVKYKDFSLDGKMDIVNLEEEFDPNDFIDLLLYHNEEKIGQLVFQLDEVSGEFMPFVEFTDGTVISVDELIEPLKNQIEIFLKGF